MKRSSSRISAAACGALMGLSMLGGSEQHIEQAIPFNPYFTMDNAEISRVEADFSSDIHYWQAQGLGAIVNTRLVVLSGKESFFCKGIDGVPNETRRSYDTSEYCTSAHDVIFDAIDYRARLAPGGGGVALVDMTVGHEIGHAVQDWRSTIGPLFTTPVAKIRLEEQATCFAGQVMQRAPRATIQAVENFLSTIATDGQHGSSQDQATAFQHGVQTGTC